MSIAELESTGGVTSAQLDDAPGPVEAGIEATVSDAAMAPEADQSSVPIGRYALAVGASTLGAAAMAGGIFNGVSPRVYAAAAGLLGVGLAVAASRLRSTTVAMLVIALGLFGIGVLLVLPSGADGLVGLGPLVRQAVSAGRNLRPPIDLTAGWIAILGWVMATVGFGATWTAVVMRRPSLAILLPLGLAGIATISVPHDQQLASGLVVFLLFAVALGVVSGAGRASSERRPAGYELRRAARALPVMAAITGAMYLLASQASFLFPHPLVDPASQAQQPKTVPLTQVPDTVLFEVKSTLTGPWVIGTLDVYDEQDGSWRLPPYDESQLVPVPRNGVVDPTQRSALKAAITIKALSGAVLPGLPNTALIVANGPQLDFDSRSQNIRIVEGQLQSGFSYTVAAPALPAIATLRKDNVAPPLALRQFTAMPAPPPAVQALLQRAPKTSKWDEFDFLRSYVLQNVVAKGQGVPAPVPISRVQAILVSPASGASPFEIVALQAMLGRWIGLPARIGYGYDRGTKVGGLLQVHPSDGAVFPEVYFPGHEWLPVIGTPAKAEATQGGDPRFQQRRTDVAPSSDIAVPIFLPLVVPPDSQLLATIRGVVLIAIAVAACLWLVYLLLPVMQKAYRRSRRRSAAGAAGPRARIIQAYAEWRDAGTDYGYRHPSDTPLMFVGRFVADEEHTELAWLVTRALWGDLQMRFDDEVAADAEAHARSLLRRLAAAHPLSVRVSAALSRLSLRDPFDERSLERIRAQEEEHDVSSAA